jgi:hypothetical protein
MSTKTTFKRIALVAVAALGLGVLSVAPSQAAVIGLAATPVNGTATTAASDSSTAATLQVRFFAQTAAADTVSVVFAQDSIPTGAVTSRLRMSVLDTSTATSVTSVSSLAENATDSATATTAVTVSAATDNTYAAAKFGVFMDGVVDIKVGTYALTAIVTPFSAGVAGTSITQPISIVVTAAAADSKVASSTYSTAFLSLGNTSASSSQITDSSVAVIATASAADVAEVNVILKNASQSTSKVVESITATITGAGVIGLDGGTTYGKSIVLAYNADANLTIGIRADGTAGVGTINISTPSVTFPAKTVTFYAKDPSTIAASTAKPVIEASSASTSDTVRATIKDANGNLWTGTAYIYATSAASALVAGSETPAECTFDTTDLRHECAVTGKTVGTAKFKVINSDSATAATNIVSNEVEVRVAVATPASVKLVFDKATYAPGEKARLSVVVLDAAGAQIVGKTYDSILAAGGITPSVAFSAGSDTLTATSVVVSATTSSTSGTTAGQQNYTVYMPMASGDVTVTATGSTGLLAAGRVAVSATASVVNSSVDAATDAANEATDAANAATVAALSATVAKLVASLKAQITSLTNLVIKIQKKVKA